MRQLKHHEQKLLKKVLGMNVSAFVLCNTLTQLSTGLSISSQVDFLSWKSDAGMREIKVMRRYHVQNR